MKKKGSALIFTLCIVTLLSALTLILVNEATSAFILTSANAKKDQVYLMAESGIEKGFNALKQTINTTPDILTSDTVTLASSAFDFTEGYITTSVSFVDIANYIDNGVSKGHCVTITSIAKNSQNKATKTLKAYILKSDISNVYFDTMFGNVITTLDTVQGNAGQSYFMQNSLTPMTLDGSMYLQGGEMNIQPSGNVDYRSGKVLINAKSLVTNTGDSNFISKFSSDINTVMSPLITSTVKKVTPTYLPMLDILTPSSYDNLLSDFDLTGTVNSGYKAKVSKQTSIDNNGNTVVSLATFKIVKNSSSTKFNWSVFMINVKYYIMKNMLGYYGSRPSNDNYGTSLENKYKGMYKLYIIDGDITVDQNDFSSFINHIIYCTGKCYLSKGDNQYINFSNSSIMAKSIWVDDLKKYHGNNINNGSNGLDLTGIGALGGVANDDGLSPYSSGNRANINKFLVQHLKGYADAFRFKVYKWEET